MGKILFFILVVAFLFVLITPHGGIDDLIQFILDAVAFLTNQPLETLVGR